MAAKPRASTALTLFPLLPALLAVAALGPGPGWTGALLALGAGLGLLTRRCLLQGTPTLAPLPAASPDPGPPPPPSVPDNFVGRIAVQVEETLATLCGCASPPRSEFIREELDKRLNWLVRHPKLFTATHESREVTVILSDLRGFTSVSENYSAGEIMNMLNRYFAHMGRVISAYGGMVDKYVGDSIMVLFGAPEGSPDDAVNAVCCAAEMQIAMNEFNRENELKGLPHLFMGIGVNTGEVIAGRLGSDSHSEYTVIGDQVNLASRIEAASLRGQVLLGESTYARVRNRVQVREPFKVSVKGKRTEVRLYELTSVDSPHDLRVPEREIRKSLRCDVNIPFRFHVCEGKVVRPEEHEGRILNLSAGGMFFSTFATVEPQGNLRFRLAFNLLGRDGGDIYGRVLRVRANGNVFDANVEFTSIDPEDAQAINRFVHSTLDAAGERTA
ncbi:MAG: adenylate/guanylate cyclase domain-containing protein [Deferrisomatales bacterium]